MFTFTFTKITLACVYFPAGLVYATVFGSAFSTASGKLYDLQAKFVNEVSMLDQIYTLTAKLDLTKEQKIKICKVWSRVFIV